MVAKCVGLTKGTSGMFGTKEKENKMDISDRHASREELLICHEGRHSRRFEKERLTDIVVVVKAGVLNIF